MKKGLKAILINVGAMLVITIVVLLILFGWYLPSFTNHGETITVPDLVKNNVEKSKLRAYLKEFNLRYEIRDSLTYERGMAPNVVVSQSPAAGTEVKENRIIYVNVNASDVPMVNVPYKLVVGQTSSDARSALVDSLGFIIDSVQYKISMDQDMVLGLIYKGDEITEDRELPKNSRVVLVVGKTGAVRMVAVPDVVNMPYSLAKRMMKEQGLRCSFPLEDPSSELEKGYVSKQKIPAGDSVKTGTWIDLWRSGTEAEWHDSGSSDSTDLGL